MKLVARLLRQKCAGSWCSIRFAFGPVARIRSENSELEMIKKYMLTELLRLDPGGQNAVAWRLGKAKQPIIKTGCLVRAAENAMDCTTQGWHKTKGRHRRVQRGQKDGIARVRR